MKTNEIKNLFAFFENRARKSWYSQMCNLLNDIDKAKALCVNTGEKTAYHFADASKVIYRLTQ